MRNLGFEIVRDQNGKQTTITPGPIAGSALMVGAFNELGSGMSYRWIDNDPGGFGRRRLLASRHRPQRNDEALRAILPGRGPGQGDIPNFAARKSRSKRFRELSSSDESPRLGSSDEVPGGLRGAGSGNGRRSGGSGARATVHESSDAAVGTGRAVGREDLS